MIDKNAIRAAISKLNRLRAELVRSAADVPRPGYVQDLSGAFVDGRVVEKLLAHLRASLTLDVEDDAIRLLFATELWGLGRMQEALLEYRAIVERDSMQAVVASRMVEEIERYNASLADRREEAGHQ
jgi:hypothetical protein